MAKAGAEASSTSVCVWRDARYRKLSNRLGQNASDNGTSSFLNDFVPNNSQPVMAVNGARRLIEISDTLPPHLQDYLTKERCINLEKAMPFLKCISYEVKEQTLSSHRLCQSLWRL